MAAIRGLVQTAIEPLICGMNLSPMNCDEPLSLTHSGTRSDGTRSHYPNEWMGSMVISEILRVSSMWKNSHFYRTYKFTFHSSRHSSHDSELTDRSCNQALRSARSFFSAFPLPLNFISQFFLIVCDVFFISSSLVVAVASCSQLSLHSTASTSFFFSASLFL